MTIATVRHKSMKQAGQPSNALLVHLCTRAMPLGRMSPV